MKLDIFNWDEVSNGEEIEFKSRRVQMRASQTGNWYAIADGYEVLVATATEIDFETSEKVISVRYEGPKAARVFAYSPVKPVHESTGEKFTNIDRKPLESGTLLEIKKGLREMQMVKAQMMRDMRAQEIAIAAKRRAAEIREQPAPVVPATPEGETEPTPQPEATPQAE